MGWVGFLLPDDGWEGSFSGCKQQFGCWCINYFLLVGWGMASMVWDGGRLWLGVCSHPRGKWRHVGRAGFLRVLAGCLE